MTLHREVGRIDLQQETPRDDGLVFDPQRIGKRRHVILEARIVLVEHRGGDDARRWRGHEGLDKDGLELGQHFREVVAFAIERRAVNVLDGADGLGRVQQIDLHTRADLRHDHFKEARISAHVAQKPGDRSGRRNRSSDAARR